MPRPLSEMLTDRESQIMEILWKAGEATAEMVREQLADQPHDSTVRTLLRVLKEKGYVKISGRQPAVYVPVVSREEVQHKAAKRLVERFFGGSADALVLRLLEDEHLTTEQLEQLKSQYATKRRKGGHK
jgi:BlaI family transcriptional regulator, penicillinase repressor